MNNRYPRWLKSCYEKGKIACLSGKTIKDCPYKDSRTWYGGITFNRARIRAWIEGYNEANEDFNVYLEDDK